MLNLLTTRQAAIRLGIRQESVCRLARKGLLVSWKVGRMYLLDRRSVQEYYERNNAKVKTDPTRARVG